jgi:hypothetical protein
LPGPLQRGDNHKNAKMGWDHLKIFISRTVQIKGQVLFKEGIITKVQNRVGSFKYFLLMNHCTIKAQVYMSAS